MTSYAFNQDRVHSVIARIIDMMQRDSLQPGDRLPSERELAQKFNVSRGTVRAATQILAFNGILTIRHGSGIYFNLLPEHTDILSDVLAQEPRDEAVSTRDFLMQNECRMIMEPQAARLAALYATPEQLAELKSTIDKMQNYILNGFLGGYAMEDMYFHRMIAESSGNPYIVHAVDAYSYDCNYLCAFGNTPNLREESFVQHCSIYQAIADHDADEAQRLAIEHVRYAIRKNTGYTIDKDAVLRKGVYIPEL